MAGMFTQDGKPLTFCMEDHSMFPILKMQIEFLGGSITSEYSSGCIKLVPFLPNYEMREEPEVPVYSYKFVQESALIGQLQNLESYRIKVTTKKPVQATYQTFFKQARNAYTEDEDATIREFVKLHPGKTSSLAYWKTALKSGLDLQHTDESLRFHWKQLCTVVKEKEMKTPPSKRRQANKYSFMKQPEAANAASKVEAITEAIEPEGFTEALQRESEPIPAELQKPEVRPKKSEIRRKDPEVRPKEPEVRPKEPEVSPKEDKVSLPNLKRKHSPDFTNSAKRLRIHDAELQASVPQTQEPDIVVTKDLIKVKLMPDGSRQILNITKLEKQCNEIGIPLQFSKLLDRCRKAAKRHLTEAEVLLELKKHKGKVIPTISRFLI